jgi:two-component system, OmpR family, phosphate regulon response regulator PhoB
MNKAHILVVDDDSKLTGLVRVILERIGGYRVQEENRPYAVLETARSSHPELIILDVQMPGRDGGDIAAELHADPELCSTPIMFLTSLVDKSRWQDGIPYLSKPFNPYELIETVRRLVPTLNGAN